MSDPVTIRLSQPIQAHGETLHELTLPAPTIGMVRKIGAPFVVVNTAAGTAVEIIPERVIQYVSRLAKIPPSSLDGLGMDDFNTLQTAVMGFFGESSTAET